MYLTQIRLFIIILNFVVCVLGSENKEKCNKRTDQLFKKNYVFVEETDDQLNYRLGIITDTVKHIINVLPVLSYNEIMDCFNYSL